MKTEEGNRWVVRFAYSGCGKREFFDKEFTVERGDNIDMMILAYVVHQNKGETKSDRIRYWSKTKSANQ